MGGGGGGTGRDHWTGWLYYVLLWLVLLAPHTSQVGHIPAFLAGVLAPPLDEGFVRYTCVVEEKTQGHARDNIPVVVTAWGRDVTCYHNPRLHPLCYTFFTYTPLDAAAALSRHELEAMRVADLRELLRDRHLPSTAGSKVSVVGPAVFFLIPCTPHTWCPQASHLTRPVALCFACASESRSASWTGCWVKRSRTSGWAVGLAFLRDLGLSP